MSDIASIIGLVGTATSSIVGATEATKNLKQIFSRAEVDLTASKQLILELLDKLIEAKHDQMAIEEGVLALQRELQQRDEFQAELARYILTDTGRGAAVYRLKDGDQSGEPPHQICPSCAANAKKSILQPSLTRHNCLYCPACRAEFLANIGDASAMIVSVQRSRRDWSDF
ncbi:cysteine-rich KTR domain-containing protein [Rhodobacter maris]|uniref:cysteine-rich KTR domain-containing protein n=1 Tax=Rhodobacter maris TaxID=446682 RepID=UPI000BE3BF98|nr:cysteine-rich KTR domain-containing protein [Rhodobacter maris]